jgi:hypothetical protein
MKECIKGTTFVIALNELICVHRSHIYASYMKRINQRHDIPIHNYHNSYQYDEKKRKRRRVAGVKCANQAMIMIRSI